MSPDASDQLDADVDESSDPDTGMPIDASDTIDSSTDSGDGDAASDSGMPELVPLPSGAREVEGIVSFVDEEAAAELETFLEPGGPAHPVLQAGLVKSINLFLSHYEELYDFVFVFTDHTLASGTIGRFESVNRAAEAGGGYDVEIEANGYRSNGRLRAAIGVQWRTPIGPPLSHEIMHQWAVRLDPRLGFGVGNTEDYGPHWGFVGMRGQLGGYDASTLRCHTPEGASPPGCTALPSGRVQYVVGQFFPNSNPSAQYSPLELYLMGLIPGSELPETIQLLTDADRLAETYDAATNTVVVEAAGIAELPFADIVARHGEVALRDADERSFSAAFIVVSSEPPPDEVLADVAEWAAAFGNRGTSGVVTSFESLTGGRATLDTQLGARRTTESIVPPMRQRFECDVLAQDCPRAELGCYGFSPSYCALSGGVEQGETCDSLHGCAPGLDCYSSASAPDVYSCNPYCDPNDDAAAQACSLLCPGSELVFVDDAEEPIGAVCLP